MMRLTRFIARASVRASAAALALALGVTGCAQIPTTGAPKLVDSIGVDQTTGFAFFPEGPADGASPEEIIRGFIEAGVGLQDNFAVARHYLSPTFAQTWDPSASVAVYDGSPSVSTSDSSSIATVDLTVVATVDERGQYTQSTTPETVRQRFELAQFDGQWRITRAPNGVMIISPRFNLVYSQQVLYFYDPSFAYRVPDVRWIPNSPSSASQLVALLLNGPADWLGGGITVTAFPEGTRLASSAVVVNSGDALVDLTSEALSADPRMKQLMLLQLRTTLAGLDTVSKVSMSVDGARLQIEDPTDDIPILNPAPYPQQLVVSHDGQIGLLGDTAGLKSFDPLSTMMTESDPRRFAIRQPYAAVVNDSGLALLNSTTAQRTELSTSTDILDPSIDPQLFTWATIGGRVSVFDTEGKAVVLDAPWLTGSVTGMRISRDGTRVALLVADGSSRTDVLVAGVRRTDNGAPVGLSTPLSMGKLAGHGVGLAWYDDKSVAVVTSSSDAATTTLMVAGGVSTTMAATDPVALVTAGTGRDSIRLLLDSGIVVSPRGSGWLPLLDSVSSIGYMW